MKLFNTLLILGVLAFTGCAKKNEDITITTNNIAAVSQMSLSDEFADSIGDRVFFGLDHHTLDKSAKMQLDKQISWLKSNPSVAVTIHGYCDERGSSAYNLALSNRRTSSVEKYLTSNGITKKRISSVGHGKEVVLVPGSDEKAWAQNRVAITVLDNHNEERV